MDKGDMGAPGIPKGGVHKMNVWSQLEDGRHL